MNTTTNEQVIRVGLVDDQNLVRTGFAMVIDSQPDMQVVVEAAPDLAAQLPPLAQATLETARTRAPGWDVYALEADWRGLWRRSGRPRLRSPDKAFLGWLDKRLAQG